MPTTGPATAQPPGTAPAAPARLGWAIILTSVAYFMVGLDTLVVITALPAIGDDLNAGMTSLQWTVNAYSLTFAAGIITAAALGDRFGRRRIYVIGLFLFTVASALCAIAPTVGLLVAARALQGIGAAVVLPLSLTILTGVFPSHRRGTVIGIWGGIGGLAVAAGPLVGGAVTEGLDWHWVFWINVPIGLLAAVLSIVKLPASRGPATRLDLPAVFLVTAGAVAIVLALVRAGTVGWGSWQTLVTLTAGAVLLAGFVGVERRSQHPMLSPRLFRSLSFSAANATAFLQMAALIAGVFLASQYFQQALGDSPLATGVRFLPWTGVPLLLAPLSGALSDRIGQRPLMVLGMLLQAAGLAWLGYAATTTAGYQQLWLPMLVAGIGIALVIPTTPGAVLGSVAPPDMGKASGTNGTLQRFGSAFGVAVGAAVFASYGSLHTPTAVTAGIRPAFAVAAGLSVLGAISALGVRRARPLAAPAPIPRKAGVPAGER